ncbi:disease resistance protein RPV1-like [Prunus dulcis]|uniref:disease resistance protein RPV1-like n=1 Tax=Prunus dulcis TaxID=3755 RepID=UPI001482A08A|nr:disease resistance protein RPV1-like [Prunus dulcis]
MDARKAHKASSSSSPSSSSKRWKYDVFLSFRGEDTRKGFTGHLHAALSGDGFRAFLDDNELKRAEFIKTQLEQAIDGSMISIIVFSKRYADSSWCLDELVKIMECRERLGQKVFPLFYNVDASDVRKQTGSFAQAFEKHEAGKHEKEKVQRWRNALSQAADLCGEDLKNADNGHEAKFINKILGEVNKQLYSKYQLDIEHPVGITSRLNDVVRMIDIENSGSKDDVRMIGIWGMGGIGKTTLAKAIYNEFEGSFEGRSFLENVREVIANQPMGLVRLQKQLLNDILKSEGIKVDSVLKGIEMIKNRLGCKRALVIIDDADDLQQLKAIAGARDWFGPGSRIVITTRDKHLLEQIRVDSTYMAQAMDEKEALEFFSWHAFERRYPDQEYLDLSKRVIRYCQGLPLALRVVGSFLIKRSIAEWESQLEKLRKSPDGNIHKILRISFDGLPDDTTRKIFLDISCFFIGDDKDYVTKILDGCGFYATIGISVLIERCLVTVSERKELMMHDLLRDMGREIVYENARGHPEKFSRLWKREDVTDVLRDKSGTDEIEGVALHLDSDLDLTRFSAQAFTNMKKLRLLHLNNVGLTGEYKDFPKKLIWLCWHGFPLESIPDDFPVQPKLVALDLQYSALKIVWKDCKLHQNLKILNLSHSYFLRKSPDFMKLPNLEELILQHCWSLSEVHSSIGDLGRLSLVNLQSCFMLKDLPLNFYKSKSIETLLLTRCSRFEKLAEGLGDMVSLTTLKADETAIRQIPSSILKLKKLKVLSLCDVKWSPSTNLLPPSLHSLSSLRELALANCSLTNDAVPKDLGSLISLERLDLACNDFCSLPSLSRLSKLQDLSLHECKNLRAIPDLPTNLKVLRADGCIALEKMPDFLEMSNIEELYLSGSDSLTEIPGLDKSLNSMTMIYMDGCTNLTADFRKNILQGWTSCGYGGIFLSGNDIPDWFDYVHDDDIVYFTVPRSVGRNFKGLTLSFVSSPVFLSRRSSISIKNMTKGAELEARIIPDCPIDELNYKPGYYLWQGQLSNDELKLQDGDKVLIEIIVGEYDDGVKVKKTGVSLVWDKFMNENMIDYHLCAYERRPSQNLVNDDDIIHVEDDNHITKSPDFSKFPNLEKLILKGCEQLYKIHSSIGDLGRLSLVNLEDCKMLRDLPLNFYKSKSIETLILNGCSRFEDLADGLGDMVSLTILEADYTAIRQIPSLAGLSKLNVLCVNACENLRAIPDLPTNLYVLKANECPELETIPDFSKMLNMRELYLNDSFKLTEVPGLDKSLNSMTRIHMEGCTNLTADFRNNILQGWTSCGYGGIFLSGNDIPDWFDCVHDDDIVYFTVPRSVGRNLKGLTLSFVNSSDGYYSISISIKNVTKGSELEARIIPDCPTEGYYLWQGQLSNDELKLQDGDKVLIEIIIVDKWVKVKKTGVSLVWDKFMNENMIDYHLCRYERRPSQNLVNDDDIIHVENDNHLRKSPDFSKFPNLEKLILKGCKYLYKVHSSIGDLGRLSLVNLEGCRMLKDLPLNFYKSKSIETLILNGCWSFEKLADGLGDMVSLTILKADNTGIRQIPCSIVKLKKLRILSLSGCWLTEDAIPKDLCSLICLEHLVLGANNFRSLPRLAGLSKLKVLCLNACRELLAIPDLPTNLYVLKANDCPELETIPDFSKMLNMRELYLNDSFKLTEVRGLDKSLNSMTRIHMECCTNLTADFRNNILQRWTSCGFGGIYLNGIYDIPEWFKIVNHVDNIVFFEVPKRIMGRDLKGLTICFVYSSFVFGPELEGPIGIIVRNLTKQTALHTKIAFLRYGRPGPDLLIEDLLSTGLEDRYLWQGQLSNDVLCLEGGDHVSILVRPHDVDFVRVKKTGVHLEWDKVMKENMDNLDPHLYDLETN